LPEALRFLKEWYLVLYGVGIVLMVCFVPEGLVGLRQRWTARSRNATQAAEAAPPADADAHVDAAQPVDADFLKARSGMSGGDALADAGLNVQAVTQRFGGLVALDAVSLRVVPGTVHAVIGPNGSGKTTFLNVLSGAYVARSGSVQLAGTELIGRRPSAITRAGLSRTFQNIRVYKSLSVLENVMVGAACHQPAGWRGLLAILAGTSAHRRQEQALRETALQALNFVGLAALAQRPAGSLAYAQQRLLEIARALATQPRVLLLDEPAAGMNPQESTRLMAVIGAIRDAGITVVFVEHNVRLVMGVSDTVTVFDFGKKIAEGTPQQVQADEAVIAAYLGRPRQRPPADPANPAGTTPEPSHA
jgi:branched-chain amino acid transport system ATP-binding protein